MEIGDVKQTLQPCPMTSAELYNKSYERFILSKGQENASIGLELYFKLYRETTMTKVEL
jgi:hypothetical protein